MKKQTRKVLLGAVTLAAVAAAGHNANAANTTLPMTAKIIAAVQITQNQALDFGTLTIHAAKSGTLTVDGVAQTRTAGGAGGISLVGGAGAQEGLFTLKGATGVPIEVTAPATAKINNGGTSLVVDKFTINNAAGTINATPFVRTLAAATETGFKVGGRLTVPAASGVGTYNGTVTLTALYQ